MDRERVLEELLHRHFGFDGFLDHQKAVVERIVSGESLCVVMPTGAGKSLCYQLPALLENSYTLVISPLIALMADQVTALRKKNIPAAFINSSISFQEQLEAVRCAENGELKLLYVAPERLQTDFFCNFLRNTPPARLIVDEAHCISEWGHDFRPSYRRIGTIARQLGIRNICAFTATATPEVCADIKVQLCCPEMQLIAAGFRRPNLNFKVIQCKGGQDMRLNELKKILDTPVTGATIIYAATRQAVDQLATLPGVRGYHAGMSIAERNDAQEYFMTAPSPVLAATNAFGMGIDRPDVRRVIHYQIPSSVEAYYQEAGRAGRDGESADCLLLFSYQDKYIQNFLIEMNNPPPHLVRSVYRVIRRIFKERQDQSDALELTAAGLKAMLPEASSDGQINAALGILEKSGAIIRHGRQTGRGELRFTSDLDHLRVLHQEEKTQRSRFIHRVIARYGKALLKTSLFQIDELAAVAALSPEQTRRVLGALNNDILTWEAGFAGRAISLADPELTEAPLDDNELKLRHEYEQSRLDAVIKYASSSGCRQCNLISYFGEDPGSWSCRCCDNCSDDPVENLTARGTSDSDIRIVLRAAELFNGRIGTVKLAQILSGSRSAGIISGNYHRNVCFGALKKLKSAGVELIIRTLLASGLLERVERNGYPCIRLSDEGRKKLRGE